jgi:hypothetical protein
MDTSGQLHASAVLLLSETRNSLNRRLGGHQSRSGRFEEEKNCLPLPGIEPRIVQPVA